MKVYNLNVNVAQPVNQVVRMQQNSEGVLSVNVANDGKYIRNLSCQMFDGENEISAISEGDNTFGYKIGVGDTPKAVKVVAKSTPMESTKEYIASYTPGTRTINKALITLVVPAGTYRQDEFMALVDEFGYKGPVYQGMILIPTTLYAKNTDFEKANFDRIHIISWNPHQQLFFQESLNDDARNLPPDEMLVVTEDITLYKNTPVKTANANSIVISSETYPAIGCYTDYQMDTTVMPTTNAHCYAECDFVVDEPSDEPSDEPTPNEQANS